VRAHDAPEPADPFGYRPQTLNALAPPSSAESAEISPAVLINGVEETGPEGTLGGRLKTDNFWTGKTDNF